MSNAVFRRSICISHTFREKNCRLRLQNDLEGFAISDAAKQSNSQKFGNLEANLLILFKFALRVLSIAASNAYNERFFSECDVVCTNRSFNMKDDLITTVIHIDRILIAVRLFDLVDS